MPFCGALGPSLVLLAQHFCFFSKPMLIIVCILGFFFMFYVRSHACLTDCWSTLPAARLPSYRFLVVVLKFSQCMCVWVFTLNINTIKDNVCCIHIGKYNNPIIIIMIIREKNSYSFDSISSIKKCSYASSCLRIIYTQNLA